jgi:hypothetical protein
MVGSRVWLSAALRGWESGDAGRIIAGPKGTILGIAMATQKTFYLETFG